MGDSLADLTFCGLSDVGLHRATNQDSYYISPSGDIFIVADGMGGHVGGKEASRLATGVIQRYLKTYWHSECSSAELLERAIVQANQAVLKDQSEHPERSDMGTTVVLLMVRQGQFWCAHVGDSRLYRLRESGFSQMTQDHTWVAQAMKTGELTLDQLHHHPWRHVLSQCIGREELAEVAVQLISIEPGDRLLLCSDGLTEELSEDAIITYLQSALTCEGAVAALIEAAKAQGGRDNITAIAISIPA